MKKLLVTLAVLTVSAFAQVGILRSVSGIHVPSAKTLPQGSLYVSGSYEMVSDGNPLSMEGFYTDNNGDTTLLSNNTPSNSETFFLGFSILDNLEIGATIPLHYDGDIEGTDLKGVALGDLQFMAKGYIPLNNWIQLGASAEVIAPTGYKGKGFRPRHRWYIQDEGYSYAYTADSWAIEGNLHVSADIIPILFFNGYVGLLKLIDNGDNFILFGGGFTVSPDPRFSLILEASSEAILHSTSINYLQSINTSSIIKINKTILFLITIITNPAFNLNWVPYFFIFK